MAINRTNILRGPGTVIYNTGNDAQTIFDATGITADVESSSKEIPSSVSGAIDTIKTDQVGTIRLTPCGQLSDDLLALLYPYGTPTIGARVFPDADVPLTVHSVAGTKVTFVNAALTTMPPLTLSPVKTAFGEAVFTALLGLGKKPSDANSFFTTASAAYASGGPDPTGIVGVQYSATFGSLNILDTLDGWTVTPEIQLEPVTTDLLGTVDYTVSGVTCTATCTPLGLTESQLLGALPIANIPDPATLAAFSIDTFALVHPLSFASAATSGSLMKQCTAQPSFSAAALLMPDFAICVSVTISHPDRSASSAFSTAPSENARFTA